MTSAYNGRLGVFGHISAVHAVGNALDLGIDKVTRQKQRVGICGILEFVPPQGVGLVGHFNHLVENFGSKSWVGDSDGRLHELKGGLVQDLFGDVPACENVVNLGNYVDRVGWCGG